MPSNLKYTKDYTELGQIYQLVLPLSLEGLVPDDDSVRLLSHELEELDYTLLYQAYSAKGRNHAASFKGRNNYSKTDPDATFMHMKDDHMRNAQFKPGYNVQIGVDSEYIVGVDIFQDRNDVWTLVPFTNQLEEKLGFRYPSVTADSGYESEEAYSYLAKKEITPFIEPQTYEQWKKLTAQYIKHSKSKSGYKSDVR